MDEMNDVRPLLPELVVSSVAEGLRVEIMIPGENYLKGLQIFSGTGDEPCLEEIKPPEPPVYESVEGGFYTRFVLDPGLVNPLHTTLTVSTEAGGLQVTVDLPTPEEDVAEAKTVPQLPEPAKPAPRAERVGRAPAKAAAIKATPLDTQAGVALFRIFTGADEKPESPGLPAPVTITSVSPLEVRYVDKPSDQPLTGNEVSVATGNDGAVSVLIRLTGEVRGANVFFCLSGSPKTSGPHYVRRPRNAAPPAGKEKQ